MTMMTTNSNAATHELSIEELDSVAGGNAKGFVDAVLAGAAAGGLASLLAGPEAVPVGVAGGAIAGGAGYLFSKFLA
jgi:hypothetical protein